MLISQADETLSFFAEFLSAVVCVMECGTQILSG